MMRTSVLGDCFEFIDEWIQHYSPFVGIVDVGWFHKLISEQFKNSLDCCRNGKQFINYLPVQESSKHFLAVFHISNWNFETREQSAHLRLDPIDSFGMNIFSPFSACIRSANTCAYDSHLSSLSQISFSCNWILGSHWHRVWLMHFRTHSNCNHHCIKAMRGNREALETNVLNLFSTPY